MFPKLNFSISEIALISYFLLSLKFEMKVNKLELSSGKANNSAMKLSDNFRDIGSFSQFISFIIILLDQQLVFFQYFDFARQFLAL